MKRLGIWLAGAALLAACTPTLETMTRAEAIDMCKARASDGARTTTGNLTLGVNSHTGPTFGAGIGINLTPKPYDVTFENCMTELAANGQIVEG